MKDPLRRLVVNAVQRWAKKANVVLPAGWSVVVEPPPSGVTGDAACPSLLTLARTLRHPPRTLAQDVAAEIPAGPLISQVEVAGPGFLNFTLSDLWLKDQLAALLDQGRGWLRSSATPQKILLEFVSANPNGPLHVGHGRGAALGDSLARIFRILGDEVTTEYYINDVGNQMDNLGASVLWRCQELDPLYVDAADVAALAARPVEDLYKGDYLLDVARAVMAETPRGTPRERGIDFFRRQGLTHMLARIRQDLEGFRVTMDGWFPESRLYAEDRVAASLARLKSQGHLKEEDGALWFRSTEFGDDKDRVLKRRDERPTYFASDVAYHDEKFRRGFDRCIDIWGTDHHGYVARLKAVVQALGHNPEKLTLVLYQLVTLLRAGQPVAMSTRSGTFVSLEEVVQEVGVDAARFFFALRSPQAQLEFDLDLAKKQASENPVFYVSYVHARCCSLAREAARRTLASINDAGETPSLVLPERALLIALASFPDVLEQCRKDLTPHHITGYLLTVAGHFHRFYEQCRVLDEAEAVTRFRLQITRGTATVIRLGLDLLGVQAPETM